MAEHIVEGKFNKLHAYIQDVREKVEARLEAVLPVPSDNAEESQLFDAMRYSVFAGGKRLRPTLILAANDVLGGREDRAINVAAAMEALHTFSLIHDDLPAMDNDDLRRGQPTCHKKYDEATAILAGDALLALPFEILMQEETHREWDVRGKLVTLFATASGAMGMTGGQMIDMLNNGRRAAGVGQGELARLQRKKTGALFEACCKASIILNKSTHEHENNLVTYARSIGLAFQMIDDVLDETSDRDTLGKTVNKDRDANKPTFTSVLGVEGAQRQAAVLCEQAEDYLAPFGERAEMLRLLARYVVSRSH